MCVCVCVCVVCVCVRACMCVCVVFVTVCVHSPFVGGFDWNEFDVLSENGTRFSPP